MNTLLHKHKIKLTNLTIPSRSIALIQLHINTMIIQAGKEDSQLCLTRNVA